ncbi:MAG: UDP-N-acetylmuramoyl-L-alanine--D-glutamate ligase [Clostridia bacterium]|nr:UDP-N-acetylmuramoyl-L-alanine--D-glutamate ligase [Clostridia bacterium]
MYLQRQSFLVLGLSRSGAAAAEFLLSRRATVYIYDDIESDKVRRQVDELEKNGAKRVEKQKLTEMVEICDALVLSPGIPIDHPLAVAFKRAKKAVLGETELAARYFKGLAVAVTGTNGKTTTVSMIEQALRASGLNAVACGNIGAPMLGVVGKSEDTVAVAEISSFQMETLNSFCPHIAVVLNISEDHLSRHYNMENYIFLKRKLLKNLSEAEFAVLNYDDQLVRQFSENTKARVIWFSMREKVNGAYYKDGDLYFGEEKLFSAGEMLTGGVHNIQNALAAAAVAKLLGLETQKFVKALIEFKGVKHRIELVGTFDGVTYIDDSKGTNVDATLKAVACMTAETVLLLGGKDKGYDYQKLFEGLKNSKAVCAILYGENRFKLLDAARAVGFTNVAVCIGFDHAVYMAKMVAVKGQTVLLSPASASFDEFTSYEERGERFVSLVTPKEEPESAAASNAADGFTALGAREEENE